MTTKALRLAIAPILLVTFGLPIDRASADGEREQRASAPVSASERAPDASGLEVPSSPFADAAPAPVAPPTAVEAASSPEADASQGPRPATRAPETPDVVAPDPLSPDMQALAAHAADQPAPPVSDDDSLAALDALLSDESSDPISGAPEEPLVVEAEGVPHREDVQQAIDTVVPAIRACVNGQAGRVVSVREVFDSSGRVRTATVDVSTAHFAPAQRSCMARAARGARLPAFETGTFEVTFPVRL